MLTGVTVVIPTIEGRERLLGRAVRSVTAQKLQRAAVVIETDLGRAGAAATRNRALTHVRTEYVAFLDDDDELYPDHLQRLARCARMTGADLVYPEYDCTGPDPNEGRGHGNYFGKPFDPGLLRRANYISVTVLARTEAVRAAGGFQPHPDINGDPCEDWGLWLAMLDIGATFAHLPHKTWLWHNDGETTKGRGL